MALHIAGSGCPLEQVRSFIGVGYKTG